MAAAAAAAAAAGSGVGGWDAHAVGREVEAPRGWKSGWMERAWVPGENHRATLHLTRPTYARTHACIRMHARTHAHTRESASVSHLRPRRASHIGSLLSAGCQIRVLIRESVLPSTRARKMRRGSCRLDALFKKVQGHACD